MLKSFCDVCDSPTGQEVGEGIITEEIVLNGRNSKCFAVDVNIEGIGDEPAQHICADCLSRLMGLFDRRSKLAVGNG